MNTKVIKPTMVIGLFSLLFVLAAGVQAKDYPNGKPFLAIQEQFQSIDLELELMQNQINQLIGDLASLEERVAANENYIAELQTENQQIKDHLAALQAQADANGEQIDINSSEIQNILAALSINNAKIEYLENQIVNINNTLATKQDILDGKCAEGYYLREIAPDGGIVCGKDEMGSDGISRVTVTHTGIMEGSWDECTSDILGICIEWTTHYPAYSRTNYCSNDYIVTGGGFNVNHNGFDVAIDITAPQANGWRILLNNYSEVDLPVTSYANCIRLHP